MSFLKMAGAAALLVTLLYVRYLPRDRSPAVNAEVRQLPGRAGISVRNNNSHDWPEGTTVSLNGDSHTGYSCVLTEPLRSGAIINLPTALFGVGSEIFDPRKLPKSVTVSVVGHREASINYLFVPVGPGKYRTTQLGM